MNAGVFWMCMKVPAFSQSVRAYSHQWVTSLQAKLCVPKGDGSLNISASGWLGLRGNVFTVARVVQKQSGVRCGVGKGCLRSGALEQEPAGFGLFFLKITLLLQHPFCRLKERSSYLLFYFFLKTLMEAHSRSWRWNVYKSMWIRLAPQTVFIGIYQFGKKKKDEKYSDGQSK